jgi:hypothetical protein
MLAGEDPKPFSSSAKLGEEFARCSWKLLRLRRVETRSGLPQQKLTNYYRSERAIMRDFYRSLHELERVQRERRRREPIPAAAALTEKMQNEPETALSATFSAASAAIATTQTLAPEPPPPIVRFRDWDCFAT